MSDNADLMSLSGLELLQAMIAGQGPAPSISKTLGFRLVEVGKGRAVFEGAPGPHVLNPLGFVHGGYALTLIDSAAGCAVHTELDAGIGYTTVETKVNFTRPVPKDGSIVRCEGRVLSRGRQIATAEAFLRDAAGKLLGHGDFYAHHSGEGEIATIHSAHPEEGLSLAKARLEGSSFETLFRQAQRLLRMSGTGSYPWSSVFK